MNLEEMSAISDPLAYRQAVKAAILELMKRTNSARIERRRASLLPVQYRDTLLEMMHRYASEARFWAILVERSPDSEKEIKYRQRIIDQVIQEICE